MKRLYLGYNGEINLNWDYFDGCKELGNNYLLGANVCVINGTTLSNYNIRGSKELHSLTNITGLRCIHSKWMIPDSIQVSLNRSLYINDVISLILLVRTSQMLSEFVMDIIDDLTMGTLINHLNILLANSSDPVFNEFDTSKEQVIPQYINIFQLNLLKETWKLAREDPMASISNTWSSVKVQDMILPSPISIFLISYGFDSIICDLPIEGSSTILPVDLSKIKVLDVDK